MCARMVNTEITCQFPECGHKVTHASEAVALEMFKSHRMSHERAAGGQKLSPIPRPKLELDVSEEDYCSFLVEWKNWKRVSPISQDEYADQLFQCCDKDLMKLLIRSQPDIVSKGEVELLKEMKDLAVVKIATSARRAQLLASKQAPGETIREFYANVRAAAAVCKFEVRCKQTCCAAPGKEDMVDYTDMVIKDVLIAGIHDPDIRKDVLATADLDKKDDKEVVKLVEAKEIAFKAWSSANPSASNNALSDYRKNKKGKGVDEADQSIKAKLGLKGKCSKCSKEISLYKMYQSGKINKTPFSKCQKCHKNDSGDSSNNAVATDDSLQGAVESFSDDSSQGAVESFFLCAVRNEVKDDSATQKTSSVTDAINPELPQLSVDSVSLDHHIFTQDGWKRASSAAHPQLRLRLTTDKLDFKHFNARFPKIQPKYVDVVVDSGAQSCLWSRSAFLKSGFCKDDLIPVSQSLRAANAAPIRIDGATIVRLAGTTNSGSTIEAATIVYISPDTDTFFLSKDVMIQLGIVGKDFPRVGSAHAIEHVGTQEHGNVNAVEDDVYAPCGCFRRELPPEKPEELPFDCVPDNAEKMKEWLLRRYASSTFNKCKHQKLPEMKGPPIQIHVNPDAKPVRFTKPVPVPLHLRDQVEQALNDDVEMEVLERVPYGEPTNWCFRMVLDKKEDGSARRTVDLSPMNKCCQREVHSSKSPFAAARAVPGDTVKTVFDAWNGYHSVPIREEDRHLTTFTTPWGLFRYRRAPQGFLSSGDGFNRRFDDITSHMQRYERIVDDSLLYDPVSNLEEHWWRVIEFIELCGHAGVVLNPEKFQFSQSAVKFAGFRIALSTVEPLPKYIDAIKGFPTPKTITDIRSWFGLVNQVSHYAQLREMMAPFRQFLSPRVKFVWNHELDQVFEKSKKEIVKAIQEGVKIFDVKRKTCLRTDWSKNGIGYMLSQKYCDCISERSFGCCEDGWKITLAGSRFLHQAEKNYAPVEGEALAVAWALEQTKYFTLGCNDLVVVTDHKPLTKLLGDRRLDEIDNPRLFRLKRRTLMWSFETEYQRGCSNPFADAMSRKPNRYAELASCSLMSREDTAEMSFISGIASELDTFFAVTWSRVKAESLKDPEIMSLAKYIMNGFPDSRSLMPDNIMPFWEIRKHLHCSDGVALFKDRIVIPKSLRMLVLATLHSAHQGVSSMFSRAQATVFWPWILRMRGSLVALVTGTLHPSQNCLLLHPKSRIYLFRWSLPTIAA